MKKIKLLIFLLFMITLVAISTNLFISQQVYGGIFTGKVDTSMNIQNTVVIDEIPKELETQRTNFSNQDRNTNKISQKSTTGEYFTTYHSKNNNNVVVKKDIYKTKRDVKYALSDENQKLLTNAVYDGFVVFNKEKGLYISKRNGKCGIVNYKGKIIVPSKYESFEKTLNEDYIIVNSHKYSGLYNLKRAKIVIPAIYSEIIPLDENNFELKLNKKIGFAHCTKNSLNIIKPKYNNFKRDKIVFKTFLGNKIGLIDTINGKLITEPIYDEIELMCEHRSKKDEVTIFKTRIDNRYGLIYYRKHSSIILSPIYEDVQYKGKVNVLTNGYWRILDNNGNIVAKNTEHFN